MVEKTSIKNWINFPTLLTICLIIIVSGWIYFRLFGSSAKTKSGNEPGFSAPNELSSLPEPTPKESSMAWGLLQDYFSAIKARDLDVINNIRYEVLDIKSCGLDKDLCESLTWTMLDSSVKGLQAFSEGEFANILGDSGQLIMATDIYPVEKGTGFSGSFAYFVKDDEGTMFILACGTRTWYLKPEAVMDAIRDTDGDGLTDEDENCLGKKEEDKNCIKTDSNQKDTDGDGWWDSIEEAAKSDPNNPQDYL